MYSELREQQGKHTIFCGVVAIFENWVEAIHIYELAIMKLRI